MKIFFFFTYSDSDDLTFERFADDCSVLEEQQVKTSKANIGVADFDRSANCLNIEILLLKFDYETWNLEVAFWGLPFLLCFQEIF